MFEELHGEGIVERIGVSNYRIEGIERAQELIDIPLYVNQVELYLLLQQQELVAFLCDQDIYTVCTLRLSRERCSTFLNWSTSRTNTTPQQQSLASRGCFHVTVSSQSLDSAAKTTSVTT